MVETTEIEKKSLEAHVELCAQRYLYLEQKLESLESSITELKEMVNSLSSKVGGSRNVLPESDELMKMLTIAGLK